VWVWGRLLGTREGLGGGGGGGGVCRRIAGEVFVNWGLGGIHFPVGWGGWGWGGGSGVGWGDGGGGGCGGGGGVGGGGVGGGGVHRGEGSGVGLGKIYALSSRVRGGVVSDLVRGKSKDAIIFEKG